MGPIVLGLGQYIVLQVIIIREEKGTVKTDRAAYLTQSFHYCSYCYDERPCATPCSGVAISAAPRSGGSGHHGPHFLPSSIRGLSPRALNFLVVGGAEAPLVCATLTGMLRRARLSLFAALPGRDSEFILLSIVLTMDLTPPSMQSDQKNTEY